LDVSIEEIEISKLKWHFEIPFWNFEKDVYNLNPIDVINFSKKYKKEHERTMESDLSYPIDVMENKGRLLIFDGLHRLAKAKILGQTKVQVRIIPRNQISVISK
jgi:hypothetical protein